MNYEELNKQISLEKSNLEMNYRFVCHKNNIQYCNKWKNIFVWSILAQKIKTCENNLVLSENEVVELKQINKDMEEYTYFLYQNLHLK